MSFIIDKSGKVTDCIGISHDLLVKQGYSCSLLKFLRCGGIRVKIFRSNVFVEYRRKLNTKQLKAINKRLRQIDVYCLVVDNGEEYWELESFNKPIRRLKCLCKGANDEKEKM